MERTRIKSVIKMTGSIILVVFLHVIPFGCNEIKADSIEVTKTVGSEQESVNATNSKILFAETNGRKIAYRSIGKGEALILCQRFRGNLDDWDPAFLDALARNYNVIIFDYSGMASSTGNPNTNALGFAKDAVDLADALAIQKFIIGGWSLGGWVAQLVTTEFPERVYQTILIGTKPPGNVKHSIEDIFMKTAYIPDYTIEHETVLN